MSSKLAPLAQAGANLEYILTRRLLSKPGYGVLYIAPITGPLQVRAARSAGLSESHDTVVLRVDIASSAGPGPAFHSAGLNLPLIATRQGWSPAATPHSAGQALPPRSLDYTSGTMAG